MAGREPGGQFQTTNWSLVEALQGDGEARRLAIEELASRYWPPIYAMVRSTVRSRDEAMDLTQAFFSEVVFTRKLFDRASSERGRLRTLLLVSLKRFLIDQHRATSTNPKARFLIAAARRIEHEERIFGDIQARGLTVDEAFDRRWAMTLLEEALQRCKANLERSGHERNWHAFEATCLTPAATGNNSPGLEAIAADLGFGSPAQVAAATQMVRKRLKLLLREVAAETADDPADREAEYQQLLQSLK